MYQKNMSFVILLNTIKNLPLLILLLIILALSIYTVSELKKTDIPGIGAEGTLETLKIKLDKHEELQKYDNQYPRVTYLTELFLEQADTNSLVFFEDAKPGDYLLEYVGATLIYNQKKDKIINMQEIDLAPADLLEKVTSNPQLASYKGVRPILIVKIHKDNLESLKQQIAGLDESFIGKYILNYDDRLVIYDYEAEQLVSNVPLQQAQTQPEVPADFFIKLLAHPELEGYKTEIPVGRQLDPQTLNQLKEDFPTLYGNAKVGDFVLQYSNRLIIYNYENDKIKDSFELQ